MTRKMSRYGAMILAVVLLVGLSCSVAAQKKVTIVHWQHHSPARFEVVQTFAEEFMKQNPNVRIEIESVPESDYFQNCSRTCGWIRARHVPDPAGQVPAYAASGVIQPIDTRVATAQQIEAEFIPPAIKRLKQGGKYYGFPVDTQTIVLFYNPALFEAAGLIQINPRRPGMS